MKYTATHISLSPDKWEQVEINITKEVEGLKKSQKLKVSLPRLRKCGNKTYNAFTHGRFSKTYIKYAAAEVVKTIYDAQTEAAVQDIRAAHSALHGQWKEEGLGVLVATMNRCARIRTRVTRAAIVMDKCQDIINACNLYESVCRAMENFV